MNQSVIRGAVAWLLARHDRCTRRHARPRRDEQDADERVVSSQRERRSPCNQHSVPDGMPDAVTVEGPTLDIRLLPSVAEMYRDGNQLIRLMSHFVCKRDSHHQQKRQGRKSCVFGSNRTR
jgi:hypothetical protein